MPGPIDTLSTLGQLVVTGEFWASMGWTVLAWGVALLVCIVIGVPLGLAIGRYRRVDDSTRFLIDFLRTIPSLALIPLVLLLFGTTLTMVVIVAVLAAIWPLLIQSIYAAQQVDPMLFQVSRSFRLKPLDRLRFVLVPDVTAFIWPGLRLAVTAALLVTVGAQLIGGAPGIGSSMQEALLLDKPNVMFAYVVASAVLGLSINAILMVLQAKLLWWHPSVRGRVK